MPRILPPTHSLPRRLLGVCLLGACLGLAACDGEAEMPKETPASVTEDVVEPVNPGEEPAQTVDPNVLEETAPQDEGASR